MEKRRVLIYEPGYIYKHPRSRPMENTLPAVEKSRRRVPVLASATSLSVYRAALLLGHSKRDAARLAQAPRSSLEAWDAPQSTPFDPALRRILETPEGITGLQKIICSALLTFVVNAGVGVPTFTRWLAESGLSSFVVASVSKWQELSRTMQDIVVEVCDAEQLRLAKMMRAPKEVVLGLDETFFPEMCLVAGDLESGFLFFEELSENRSAATWASNWEKNTNNLNLKLVQAVSDGGLGIRGFVESYLGIHRSPDLFHILHDVSRGLSLFLARRERAAQEKVDKTRAIYTELRTVAEIAEKTRKRGRPIPYPKYLAEARGHIASAEKQLQIAEARRDQFRDLLHELSNEYLPFCIDDGTRKGSSYLAIRIKSIFAKIHTLAKAVSLPEGLQESLWKAERCIPSMIANLEFFSRESEILMRKYGITGTHASTVHSCLVPAALIQRRLGQLTSEGGERLRLRAQELIKDGMHRLGEDGNSEKMRNFYLRVAAIIASRWHRSSSAIEGRNGLLSQRHHSLRGLNGRKLRCLTCLGNYYARRSDGTTAANRLFGREHLNLADAVTVRMPTITRALRRKKSETHKIDRLCA